MTKSLEISCAFLLGCLLTGCGAAGPKEIVWRDAAVDLAWPAPPARERIRYMRTITGAADFNKDTEKSSWKWFFGEEQGDLPLLTPLSAVSDGEGLVWVADSGAKMLYRVDLSRERVDYILELAGERLVLPAGLAIENQPQVVYLSDAALNKVFVLSYEGELIKTLAPPDGFKRPAGMTIDTAGSLYVADVLDGSLAVFDKNGEFQRRIYSRSSENGRFNRPVDVAIGPAGEVVVLVAAAFHLEVQSAEGELLQVIGRVGDAAGHFARPKSVAVDAEGHIFVSDAAFDNIQVFDIAGNLLTFFGGPGSGPGEFNLPAGLSVDPGGRLLAADSYNHRVQVFQLIP